MECMLIDFHVYNELNKRMSNLKWLQNIDYFPNGSVDTVNVLKFRALKGEKIVILDRNLFDRLIKIATTGVTNQGRIQDIALLMSWCMINGCGVYPYPAISEHASLKCDEKIALNEYKIFDEIFKKINPFIWFNLAQGKIIENPVIIPRKTSFPSSQISFVEKSVDYLFNYMAMLHLAYVLRTKEKQLQRFFSFYEWYYNHSLISRYTSTYVSLFLAGYAGFAGPKSVMARDINKVMAGCSNQAKDLCYLTEYSKDRVPSNYEFVFASDDHMLCEIYNLANGSINPIKLFEKNIKNNTKRVSEWVEKLETTHKMLAIPKEQYANYCEEQIQKEINLLKTTFT